MSKLGDNYRADYALERRFDNAPWVDLRVNSTDDAVVYDTVDGQTTIVIMAHKDDTTLSEWRRVLFTLQDAEAAFVHANAVLTLRMDQLEAVSRMYPSKLQLPPRKRQRKVVTHTPPVPIEPAVVKPKRIRKPRVPKPKVTSEPVPPPPSTPYVPAFSASTLTIRPPPPPPLTLNVSSDGEESNGDQSGTDGDN